MDKQSLKSNVTTKVNTVKPATAATEKKVVTPKKVTPVVKKPVVQKPAEKKAVKPEEKKVPEKKAEVVNDFTAARFVEKLNKSGVKGEFIIIDTSKKTEDAKFIGIKFQKDGKDVIYKLAYTRDNNHRISLAEQSVDLDILLPAHSNGTINVQIYSTALSLAVEDAVVPVVAKYGEYKMNRTLAKKEEYEKLDADFRKTATAGSESICKALETLKDDPRLKSGRFCGTDDKPADYQHLQAWLNK